MNRIHVDLSLVKQLNRSYFDELRRGLEPHDLWGMQFLYTAIDGARLDEFAKKGTYRKGNTIFAYHTDDLEGSAEDDAREEIEDHLRIYQKPALAIWHEDHFMGGDIGEICAYQFLRPQHKLEAVAAVALLTL